MKCNTCKHWHDMGWENDEYLAMGECRVREDPLEWVDVPCDRLCEHWRSWTDMDEGD